MKSVCLTAVFMGFLNNSQRLTVSVLKTCTEPRDRLTILERIGFSDTSWCEFGVFAHISPVPSFITVGPV